MTHPIARSPIPTACIAVLALTIAAGGVRAQAPPRLSNSTEAVRQYEQGTFDSLRERCTHIRSDAVRERAEVAEITNGFLAMVEDNRRGQQRYALFAYDRDSRVFTLIDGQRLGRDARLTLPLALPRDYANCRIVRNARAQEFVEVVHLHRNALSSVEAANRLYDDTLSATRALATTMAATEGHRLCTNPTRSGAARAHTQLLSDGQALALGSCPDAVLYLAERTDRLLHKVFGR